MLLHAYFDTYPLTYEQGSGIYAFAYFFGKYEKSDLIRHIRFVM